jgi:hypothetical protein
MFSNRLTFIALAVACVTAAGAGGYFASRPNTLSAPAVAATSTEPAADTAALDRPVEETEAVVAPEQGGAAVATPRIPAPRTPATSRNPEAMPRRAEPTRNTRTPPAESASTATRQNSPEVERTWPAGTQSPSQASSLPSSPPATADITAAPVEERPAFESPRAPEPPQKVFDELVVSANSVIGLETETRISSETARIEDRVEAKVTRDVRVGDIIAIPAGSRAIGSVIQVERGGKFKERARLGIRFSTLVLADGTRLPMSTETIYREGAAPGNSSAAKIGGGAIGGAILGAILGGAKGAAIGATAGAGGGVAAVQVGDRQEVTLAAGSPMTVRLLTPLTVTVEQQ